VRRPGLGFVFLRRSVLVKDALRKLPRGLYFAMAIGLTACTTGTRSPEARIDGTSEEAFDRSYARVVQHVATDKRRQLALDLLSVLLPQNCLRPEAVLYLTFFPASPDRKAEIRTCRVPLNGMSYQDIVDAAAKSIGPKPAPSSNSQSRF
jgi:hypothetical protein